MIAIFLGWTVNYVLFETPLGGIMTNQNKPTQQSKENNKENRPVQQQNKRSTQQTPFNKTGSPVEKTIASHNAGYDAAKGQTPTKGFPNKPRQSSQKG